MIKTESDGWKKIREASRPDIHWTRVENAVISGMPDVNGNWRKTEVWLELKMLRGSQIKVRYSQIIWWNNRLLSSGIDRVYVVVFDGATIHVYACVDILKRARLFQIYSGKMIPSSLKGITRSFGEDSMNFSLDGIKPLMSTKDPMMVDRFLFGV